MRKQHWWLPLVAFVFLANCKLTTTLPVPDEQLDISAELVGSSVVTSVSVVTGVPHNAAKVTSMSTADRRRIMPSTDLPGSPPDLMRPDKFQFFTLNKEGNLVTKQMTEQEIHSLIAAGGGHLPMDILEPQRVGSVPSGGMKVAEVVQNVQNVLKGELNKPATVMASMPTIPGHVNTEWSSILPAILGGESESTPVNDPGSPVPTIISEKTSMAHTTTVKAPDFAGSPTITTELPPTKTTAESSSTADYEMAKKPTGILETESQHTEKPMIQVPVITVDQKLPSHQHDDDSMPVFQILNTISADKINGQKNASHVVEKPDKTHVKETPEKIETAQTSTVEPSSVDEEEEIIEHDTAVNENVPEMIEINYNSGNVVPSVISHVVKPIAKPLSVNATSASSSLIPESKLPATMTVISETSSTSMKVSGDEKIQLREPPTPIITTPGPIVEAADDIRVTITSAKPQHLIEQSAVTSTTESNLKLTTLRTKESINQSQDETTEKNILQKLPSVGDPPQLAISDASSELVSSNAAAITTSTIGDNDGNVSSTTAANFNESCSGACDSIKRPQTTTFSTTTQTAASIASNEEEVISEMPADIHGPIYQKIPEIIPDKNMPAHGTLPSQVSSIEHIIGTLNDPTGSSMHGAVGADHLIGQIKFENRLNVSASEDNNADSLNTMNILEVRTSTSATPINVEPTKSSYAKPAEPIPNELADSLTSMISQISDAMPSVLPLDDSVGLDTTEKKNTINLSAEEPEAVGSIAITESAANITNGPVDPVEKVQTSVKAPLVEQPVPTTAKIVDSHDKVLNATTVEVSDVTEKSVNTPSSASISSTIVPTTQLSNIDSASTTVGNALVNKESLHSAMNKIHQVVEQKIDAFIGNTEKSKPTTGGSELESQVASAGDVTSQDKEFVEIEAATEGTAAAASVAIQETNSTTASPMIDTSTKNSITTAVSTDGTETTKINATDGPSILAEYTKLKDEKTNEPSAPSKENVTELPIVRLDIKEITPIMFHTANESQPINSANDGMESPLVRIKLTDPVTLANNIIESSSVNAYLPPVAPVSLPDAGTAPANTIASGLIAGFPSTTTSATTTAVKLDHDANSTPSAVPIKTWVSLSSSNDTPANNVTDVKTSDPKESTVQVESVSATETQLEKKKLVVENIDTPETSTSKVVLTAASTETSLEHRIDLPKAGPVQIANSKESMTVRVDSIPEITSSKPAAKQPTIEITPTKTAQINSSTTPTTTTVATPHNQSFPIKLTENATKPAEYVPTKPMNASQIAQTLEPVHISIPAGPSSPLANGSANEKLGEFMKMNEMTVSSSTLDSTTPQTVSAGTEIPNPAMINKLANVMKSEPHGVAIDDALKNASEEKVVTNLQSTNEAAVEVSKIPKDPLSDGKVPISHAAQDSLPVVTTASSIDQPSDRIKAEDIKTDNVNVSMQVDTVSTIETTTSISTTNPIQNKLESKDDDKKIEKLETIAGSKLSEKTPEASSPDPASQNTQQVRIRVNDTAVLVAKLPAADTSSQKVSHVTQQPENQGVKEQSTTPKPTSSVHADAYVKLGEKVQLPLPIESNGLSSSDETKPLDSPSNKGPVGSSEPETRTRLGEEPYVKIDTDETPTRFDTTRKPITKNNDGNPAPSADKVISSDSVTETPSQVNNETSAIGEKDSDPQLSAKVEIVMNVSSNAPLTDSSNSNGSSGEKKNPTKSHESKKPSKVVTNSPISIKPTKPAHKVEIAIKKDTDQLRPTEDEWTLIPQQPHPTLSKTNGSHGKRPSFATESASSVAAVTQEDQKISWTERSPVSLDHPQSASGLDSTVTHLENDITYFTNLCNELAFTFWTATNKGLSTSRSLAVSPFGMTSMLAMVFLGARGPTSDQMNDVLKLDDVASFNPHLVFQNVTDAVGLARNQGIANAAFVRQLFADRLKVRKLMPFYKEQAQQFYDGVVTEVNFATISDLVRRRTNLMIRKQTGGRIKDFVRTNTVPLRSPLAALSANVFQTDCNSSPASSEGRDGELYFAVSPAVRQRKLVPIPATVWRAGVLAGYEPSLDATVIALGGTDKLVSTIFVIPGQQGVTAPGDTLDRLEQRLVRGAMHDGAWNKLLKVLIPRPGLELQVPKFSHRSVINATAALKRMGLEELFSKHADLKGINGVATDLHLADVLQMNLFSTCGDENIINGRHHVEVYPGSPLRNARREDKTFEEANDDEQLADYLFNGENADLIRQLIKSVPNRRRRSERSNETTEKPRLKLDRPFLYFVRHNPTGLILHMGRFNPRLLP